MHRFQTRHGIISLLTAIALGCGGGGGTDEVDEENAARTEGGEVIAGAAGALNVEAHNHWLAAQRLYVQNAEAGWNEQRCSATRAAFEEAVEAQGNFAEAIYMSGLVAEDCGDTSAARGHYTRALQVAEEARRGQEGNPPGNGPLCKARVALGLLDQAAGNRGPAQQAFQRSIREDPQCTSGYVNLAITQREAGGAQVTEALRNLRRALAIESDYLPAFNQMALLHYQRGKGEGGAAALDLAEVVCRQAQLINRNYAPIYNTWGLVKIEQPSLKHIGSCRRTHL